MRRIAFILLAITASAGSWVAATAGADDNHTYNVEMDNAFGLVTGSDVKVAGVIAGSIKDLDVNESKRAVVKIEVSGPFSDFRSDATCSSEPQSLIAEYFIDCQPGHDTQKSSGFIPVENTTTTVSNDLVNNTLREPFKQRFQLLLNEFGTALAGNPENLNAAIRRGAPALRSLREALEILGKQNKIIRDLNANSDVIIGKLADNSDNVVRFIENAGEAAAISASRREDLARNFNLLPDFLAELQPTLAALGDTARQQTPILTDLRASAPELNRLVRLLPPFNDATRVSLLSLGDAGKVGIPALNAAQNEINQLNQASQNFPGLADDLAKFFKSLDDPRMHVEDDQRATDDNCKTTPQDQLPAGLNLPSEPPQCDDRQQPMGYTGLEGLLNYVYWQTTAINQFDQIGHMLHFILYEVESSPCFEYNAGHKNGPSVATSDGLPLERDLSNLHRCVSWTGDNQPDVCLESDAEGNCPAGDALTPFGPSTGGNVIPRYPKEVCDEGSDNLTLCDPNAPNTSNRAASRARGGGGNDAGGGNAGGGDGGDPRKLLPDLPKMPKGLDGLLGLPENALKGLSSKERRDLGIRGSQTSPTSPATDLLDFLFGA